MIGMLRAVTSRLAPTMPITDEEAAMIQDPLEQVLYKHGGAIPCEWNLAIALALVAFPRYQAIKEAKRKAGGVV